MDDKDVIEQIIKNINNLNSLLIIFSTLLSVNIVTFLGKFLTESILKNKEIKIYKKNIVTTKRIDIIEQLFNKLEHLTILDQTQSQILLTEITDIERYASSNKLYIDKNIQKITIKILDYFKPLIQDYSKKNYTNEITLFDEFVKDFNK